MMGIKGTIHGQDLHRLHGRPGASTFGLAFPWAILLMLAPVAVVRADPTLPTIPANTFTITSFGAIGDGTTDNAGSIQNAINAAASAGGGTVVVAAVGVLTNYLSGPINLSNNICIQINGGAKLQMLPMSSWPDPQRPLHQWRQAA
jgi:hypothetical protein